MGGAMLLQNERLAITVAEPHVFPDTTSRFDHAGFITSVLLDNKYEFCTSEPTNLVHPSTGGVGLCNEYLFPKACDEVSPGELFPKFGIGLFTKPDDDPFCFFRKYETDYFPVTWEQPDGGTLIFRTEPVECNGYAVSQVKTLTISHNRLTMANRLKNEGKKPLVIKEFCHNFMTLERKPLGASYTIEMPALHDRGSETVVGTVCGNGHGYTYTDYNPKAALVNIAPEEIDNVSEFEWFLRHKESKASVKAKVSFKPEGIDIWSIDHIISVETFFLITLEPGETTEWARQWSFCNADVD